MTSLRPTPRAGADVGPRRGGALGCVPRRCIRSGVCTALRSATHPRPLLVENRGNKDGGEVGGVLGLV